MGENEEGKLKVVEIETENLVARECGVARLLRGWLESLDTAWEVGGVDALVKLLIVVL